MAKFERLEPRAADMPVFDGSVDDDEDEEGSRLPLLIVIALLVLFAFAGVVWLAYTQGVERGRADAPRIVVAEGSAATKMKVYQQPVPSDDQSADADSVPLPPTPVAKAPVAAAPVEQSSPNLRSATTAVPEAAPRPAAAPVESPPSTATAAPGPKMTAATAAPEVPRVATHAPAPLIAPSESEPSIAPATKAAAPEEAAKPAASGGLLLQIGSYKSQDEAETAWRAFQSKHPVVGGYQSDIKQVDLGDKGTWYRLRLGSFADKDAALALCAKLKADGASCFMAR